MTPRPTGGSWPTSSTSAAACRASKSHGVMARTLRHGGSCFLGRYHVSTTARRPGSRFCNTARASIALGRPSPRLVTGCGSRLATEHRPVTRPTSELPSMGRSGAARTRSASPPTSTPRPAPYRWWTAVMSALEPTDGQPPLPLTAALAYARRGACRPDLARDEASQPLTTGRTSPPPTRPRSGSGGRPVRRSASGSSPAWGPTCGCVDVDVANGKVGDETLADLEAEHGSSPTRSNRSPVLVGGTCCSACPTASSSTTAWPATSARPRRAGRGWADRGGADRPPRHGQRLRLGGVLPPGQSGGGRRAQRGSSTC